MILSNHISLNWTGESEGDVRKMKKKKRRKKKKKK